MLSVSDFPDTVECRFHVPHITFNCCRFNQRGTLIATGTEQGSTYIWDTTTKSIVKILPYPTQYEPAQQQSYNDKKSNITTTTTTTTTNPVLGINWSSCGIRLLCWYLDYGWSIWDIISGRLEYSCCTESNVIYAAFKPHNSHICLICPANNNKHTNINANNNSPLLTRINYKEQTISQQPIIHTIQQYGEKQQQVKQIYRYRYI